MDRQLETAQAGIREWLPKITEAAPEVAGDPRLPVLAARLANLHRNHGDADTLLHTAVGQGSLPDDHPADALTYRITTLAKRRHEMPPPIWETVTPRRCDTAPKTTSRRDPATASASETH